MKRLLPILLIILLSTPGFAYYSWTGTVDPGTILYVGNLTVKVDREVSGNRSILSIGDTYVMEGQKKTIQELTFEVKTFNNKTYVLITSEKPFEVKFSKATLITEKLKKQVEELKAELESANKKIKALQDENARLKRRLSELEKQKQTADVSKLKRQIANLTRENRALREQIANLTERINALLGENEFLKQQNSEYKKLISSLLKEQAQRSEQDYLEKAKREKLIGSILLKSLVFSLMIVITAGYLLYRAKRSYEYGGL
ncbi:hypothetical protein [Pyrococcus kukulkanii]|uniref:Chromosome partition protein Smc n=1 Tax=Pyrococcus kukulkanii TaxID=1609559 RepID=A0A127B894_9EURY|nr:hypothetical protein [Pyrococcus kukulkanii]AMM53488.1 hypothetical protein TQ32_02535 [Pyrococcus kukulkanii]